jgi:hypothetical protein
LTNPVDPMKAIADELAATRKERRSRKAARTVSVDDHNFVRLQRYCADKQVRVSDVLDKLIAAYLKSLEERREIPPDDYV